MMHLKMLLKKRMANLLLLVTLMAIGCKKESKPMAAELMPPEAIVTANTKFLVDGVTEVTMGEFQNANNFSDDGATESKGETTQNTCVVVDANGQNYIFTSENSLRTWASAADSRTAYINKLDSAEIWQQYADNHGMLDDSIATVIFTDSIIASEASSNAGPAPLLTGLYNGYNYSGTFYWLPVVSIRPTFGNFNSKASSLADYYLLPKLNMLAAKTWFRGSKFFYWSWRQIPTLGSYNFDNKTCSKL